MSPFNDERRFLSPWLDFQAVTAAIVPSRLCRRDLLSVYTASPTSATSDVHASRVTFRVTYVRVVMLERLIDELFPEQISEPWEACPIVSYRRSHPNRFDDCTIASPLGRLSLTFHSSDHNVDNLEASASARPRNGPIQYSRVGCIPQTLRMNEAECD